MSFNGGMIMCYRHTLKEIYKKYKEFPFKIVLTLDRRKKGTKEFHKRSRNSMNRDRVLSLVTVWEHLTRIWPLTDRDNPERDQGEISWSFFGNAKQENGIFSFLYFFFFCFFGVGQICLVFRQIMSFPCSNFKQHGIFFL